MRLSQLWVLWGGVIASCSNGSDSTDDTPPEDNEDVPEDWTAITVGDIEKYDGQNGTSSYTVTKNNDGSITISHDAAMAKYASCSFKPKFSDNNTLYTKITNNSDVEATVQIQVNKAGTEANGYEPTPTITAVYVDGEKQENASAYGVELKIPANESVVIANMFDLEKNPDTVAISLNSQEKIAGTVEKGNITVSGISMKKFTDESELEEEINNGNEEGEPGVPTPSPDPNPGKPSEDEDDKEDVDVGGGDGDNNEEGKEPVTPPAKPEETVIYKLDFSGDALPENWYDNIKDSKENVEFKAGEGVSIKNGWSYFAIVPKDISEKDFGTANYVKATFKCSDGATFEEKNNRLMVAVYNTDEDNADTNFSWTAFFDRGNDGDVPTEFKTVEKEIKWEEKYDENGNKLPLADTSKVNGIRIWTQAFTGTVTIQSIEFIKK